MAHRLANKVLLIGWDAADWGLARPLLHRGLMPTLQRLLTTGAWGNLASLQPMLSPMLWNSIATGKRPAKHGILGFTEVAPDGQSVRPVSSTSRKSKAVWNILNQSDLRSVIVGWYASHPAEPIEGVCVSNQFEAPVAGMGQPWPVPAGAVHPVAMVEELAALRVHPQEIQPDAVAQFLPALVGRSDWSGAARIGKLRTLIAQSASIHAVATHLLQTQPWDFAAVYYEGIDRFGHEFMHAHPPQMQGVSDEEFALYNEVMNGCYVFHDMMLQALLDAAGPDTTVILVSDHGYAFDHHRPADIQAAGPTDWHRPFGIAVCSGPGFTDGGQRLFGASLLDITPTVLQLLGRPVGLDMDGRPWVELFDQEVREIDRVPSWEDMPGNAGTHPGDLRHDPQASAESLKQLIALAYVAPLGDNAAEAVRQTLLNNELNLAISLMDARQPAAAEPILRKLCAQKPDDAPLGLQLALCLSATGKTSEAREIAGTLAASGQVAARALMLLGAMDFDAGDHERALARLLEAQRIGPMLHGLEARLGSIYLGAGRLDEARTCFERSIEEDPENPVALDGLAEVSLAQGRYEQAMDFALDAVGLVHHFPRAHLHLAYALAGLNRTAPAIEAASLAARLAPGFRQAHQLLVDLYQQAGDTRRAAEHALQAAPAPLVRAVGAEQSERAHGVTASRRTC